MNGVHGAQAFAVVARVVGCLPGVEVVEPIGLGLAEKRLVVTFYVLEKLESRCCVHLRLLLQWLVSEFTRKSRHLLSWTRNTRLLSC
jgi:hypothetical protein